MPARRRWGDGSRRGGEGGRTRRAVVDDRERASRDVRGRGSENAGSRRRARRVRRRRAADLSTIGARAEKRAAPGARRDDEPNRRVRDPSRRAAFFSHSFPMDALFPYGTALTIFYPPMRCAVRAGIFSEVVRATIAGILSCCKQPALRAPTVAITHRQRLSRVTPAPRSRTKPTTLSTPCLSPITPPGRRSSRS